MLNIISGVKAKYLSGGAWKVRKLQKGVRASRESGKKKGLVPPAWAKYCAKNSRAYKTEIYTRWDAVCNGDKIKWGKA